MGAPTPYSASNWVGKRPCCGVVGDVGVRAAYAPDMFWYPFRTANTNIINTFQGKTWSNTVGEQFVLQYLVYTTSDSIVFLFIYTANQSARANDLHVIVHDMVLSELSRSQS